MKVGTLLSRNVVTCNALDSLEHVMRLMIEADVGSVVVIDQSDRVIGLVTDRDVAIAAYRNVRPLRDLAVTVAITGEPVACRETDDSLDVERVMRERHVRRVLVMDPSGMLVGIVTLDDLARAAHAGHLPAEEIAATLAAISPER